MSQPAEPKPVAVVVDDDFLIREDALEILREAGFATLEARTGDEGISVLEQAGGGVELLFTDVQMPGAMDGFALAREVARRWPHIGIVVASGAIGPGPDDMPDGATFIAKPFSADIVHDHIGKVLPDHRRPALLRGRGSTLP